MPISAVLIGRAKTIAALADRSSSRREHRLSAAAPDKRCPPLLAAREGRRCGITIADDAPPAEARLCWRSPHGEARPRWRGGSPPPELDEQPRRPAQIAWIDVAGAEREDRDRQQHCAYRRAPG
jgi:hypothetical protein